MFAAIGEAWTCALQSMAKQQLEFCTLPDTDGRMARLYGISDVSGLFIIGQAGFIQHGGANERKRIWESLE